jgi:single-strand DNA-binding protein
MANLNKVMLIGRLTRDPEVRTFSTGGKVAAFGFAVNNRRKNATTGQWEDEPVFLDVEAFNRGEGRQQLADQVEQYLRKGKQIFIEGHLRLDQWTAPDGQKRSKIKIVVDSFQYLDPRTDGGGEGGGMRSQREGPSGMSSAPRTTAYNEADPADSRGEEEIPF